MSTPDPTVNAAGELLASNISQTLTATERHLAEGKSILRLAEDGTRYWQHPTAADLAKGEGVTSRRIVGPRP